MELPARSKLSFYPSHILQCIQLLFREDTGIAVENLKLYRMVHLSPAADSQGLGISVANGFKLLSRRGGAASHSGTSGTWERGRRVRNSRLFDEPPLDHLGDF